VRFELSFRFASDFADIFEVRGASRPRRGIARAPSIGPDAVLLNYEGLDGVLRQTKVVFDPAPNTLEHHTARYQLTLAPNQVAAIFLALACGPAETWKPNFFKGLLAARRETRAATRNAATVQTSTCC
jgi:glycogen debranching enzyme